MPLSRLKAWLLFSSLITILSVACGGTATPSPALQDRPIATMSLTSPAFAPGESIPVRYSCEGENIPPPLEWSEAPPGTESLALIIDDPDAPHGTFTHWLVFNEPASRTGFPEGAGIDGRSNGAPAQGQNSGGGPGYIGPCPPRGPAHTYRFFLWALDQMLDLGEGASAKDLQKAMRGHVLGVGQLEGTYARK